MPAVRFLAASVIAAESHSRSHRAAPVPVGTPNPHPTQNVSGPVCGNS